MKKALLLLLSPLFNFLQSCISPLGDSIDPKVSDSYYSSKSSKEEVIFSPMGNWFELGSTKFKADRNSFIPLANDLAKDKDSVYYGHKGQPQVDRASFTIKDRILCDKNHVYYRLHDYMYTLPVVEDADPETFFYPKIEGSAYNIMWAKDKAHYFLDHKKVDVDYQTFSFITENLVADKNTIYSILDGKLVPLDTVTGKIEKIHNYYATMGSTLYFMNPRNGISKIDFEKINTIKTIDDYYVLVNNIPIVNGKRFLFAQVDVLTFETYAGFDYLYAKDKNHVYFDGQVIETANPATFQALGFLYGKDDQRVFFRTDPIPTADPKSFDVKDGTPADNKTRYRAGKPF